MGVILEQSGIVNSLGSCSTESIEVVGGRNPKKLPNLNYRIF